VAAELVVELEDVNPTAENEEDGLMKNDPTDVELESVAFQGVVVPVVMDQVIGEKAEGREVVSAM
jgi:hypothetical protein